MPHTQASLDLSPLIFTVHPVPLEMALPLQVSSDAVSAGSRVRLLILNQGAAALWYAGFFSWDLHPQRLHVAALFSRM